MEIKLSKPIIFEGKEYTELTLDLDGITGRDLLKVEAEARIIAGSAAALVAELSKSYHAVVAAKAAGVPVDLILALPAKDFTKITVAVQNFLFE